MAEKVVNKTPEVASPNMSERFMNKVMAEFGGNVSGDLRINVWIDVDYEE